MCMHSKASASLSQANDLLSLGAGGGAGTSGRKLLRSSSLGFRVRAQRLRRSRQAQNMSFELQLFRAGPTPGKASGLKVGVGARIVVGVEVSRVRALVMQRCCCHRHAACV